MKRNLDRALRAVWLPFGVLLPGMIVVLGGVAFAGRLGSRRYRECGARGA